MLRRCSKLSGEDRKKSIIQAVRKVFAEKGFHGTTTRALAQAAGVSEALLFKHFPNKEALYSAMQVSCFSVMVSEKMDRIKGLESSTSTLVVMMHMMASSVISHCNDMDGEAVIHHRLMMRSMMEDGEFARIFIQNSLACWSPKVEECLAAAVAEGEACVEPISPKIAAMFSRHLSRMIMLSMMTTTPIVDYGVSKDCLVHQAVWFALRGMGVHDEAIKRYYNPESLALFA
jgi:AcrR family transcriptional regulator